MGWYREEEIAYNYGWWRGEQDAPFGKKNESISGWGPVGLGYDNGFDFTASQIDRYTLPRSIPRISVATPPIIIKEYKPMDTTLDWLNRDSLLRKKF